MAAPEKATWWATGKFYPDSPDIGQAPAAATPYRCRIFTIATLQ